MAGWFYWKDAILEHYQQHAAYLGIDPEKIILGKQEQIPPSINIFLSSEEPTGRGHTSSGAAIACKMVIRCLIVVPGEMNDVTAQDNAMRLAIKMARAKPRGVTFESITSAVIYDASGNQTNNVAMAVEFSTLYTLEDE